MACCPFHAEKPHRSRSYPREQFYHCFGCGHGNAIGFLMAYERLDSWTRLRISPGWPVWKCRKPAVPIATHHTLLEWLTC
ncbi:MAG: CHC2 zinc finger domain-containing protein [Candidatus Competibacteraceae bacterium]